jgi:hypothetical protein
VNSREKLIKILRNTEKLAGAVRIALQTMAKRDPDGFAKGEASISVLGRAIAENGVETDMSAREFAAKLAGTATFREKFRNSMRQ